MCICAASVHCVQLPHYFLTWPGFLGKKEWTKDSQPCYTLLDWAVLRGMMVQVLEMWFWVDALTRTFLGCRDLIMSPAPTPVAHSVFLAHFRQPNNLSSGTGTDQGRWKDGQRHTHVVFLLPFQHIVQMFPFGNNICKWWLHSYINPQVCFVHNRDEIHTFAVVCF